MRLNIWCNYQNILKRNTYQLIVHIKNIEGFFRGFYKGITLNFIKGPIAIGTSLSMKNLINRTLDKNYDIWFYINLNIYYNI